MIASRGYSTVQLSVIIPTLGREQILFETVATLLPQLLPEEEIIVVDQNRPGLTWPADLGKDTRLHIIHRRRPGLTRARNAGLSQARHAFAVFLDDDILPDANLLAEFRRAAQTAPNQVWTGRITQKDIPTSIQPPTDGKQIHAGPVGFVDLDSGEIVTDYSHSPTGEVPFFAGGLCLLPLHSIGRRRLFSPAFKGAAQGEEIDLALRLRKRGIRIECDPRIHVVHLKASQGGCRSPSHIQRFAMDEMFNRAYFWARHGNLQGWRHFYRRSRAFIEFHTRIEPSSSFAQTTEAFPVRRHSLATAIRLFRCAFLGLSRGLLSRLSLKKKGIAHDIRRLNRNFPA